LAKIGDGGSAAWNEESAPEVMREGEAGAADLDCCDCKRRSNVKVGDHDLPVSCLAFPLLFALAFCRVEEIGLGTGLSTEIGTSR
jgi:hypothetical protein